MQSITELNEKAQREGQTADQSVPRFNIESLRPFKVMFADEKLYDVPQRSTTSPASMLVALGRCYNLQVGASGLLVSQAHGSRWHGMLARCFQGQVGTWRARQAVVK